MPSQKTQPVVRINQNGPEKAKHLESQPQQIDQSWVVAAVAAFDAALVIVTGLGMAAIQQQPVWFPLLLSITISGLVLFTLQHSWAYTVNGLSNLVRQSSRLLLGMGAAFAVLIAIIYIFSLDALIPRQFVMSWFGSCLALMAAARFVTALLIKYWSAAGRLIRKAVIVGGGRPAEDLIKQLRRSKLANIKVCGVFDDRAKDRSADPSDRYRVLGTFTEMEEFCRQEEIDLIIVTLPPSAEDRILQLMRQLWVLPIDVRVSAHQSKLRLRPRAYSYIGDIPFLAVFDKPLSDWGWVVKEVEDRVIALIALILLSPVMIAVACAVKFTSKGPILFKQKRHGFNNQLIDVYKFRSMYTDMCDAHAVKQVTKGDPRVTPVGRFIRKSSLDELPQLFNVLKGELSLVGPRPHATGCKAGERLYNDVVDGYYARHRMKPGITGLAQINGWRGETDTEEKLQRRVEYDIQYIDHWSLWMDLYILAMTPVSLLNTKNAY
jgi:Undecaprenyl-phosphate glucose phosphotransferase